MTAGLPQTVASDLFQQLNGICDRGIDEIAIRRIGNEINKLESSSFEDFVLLKGALASASGDRENAEKWCRIAFSQLHCYEMGVYENVGTTLTRSVLPTVLAELASGAFWASSQPKGLPEEFVRWVIQALFEAMRVHEADRVAGLCELSLDESGRTVVALASELGIRDEDFLPHVQALERVFDSAPASSLLGRGTSHTNRPVSVSEPKTVVRDLKFLVPSIDDFEHVAEVVHNALDESAGEVLGNQASGHFIVEISFDEMEAKDAQDDIGPVHEAKR